MNSLITFTNAWGAHSSFLDQVDDHIEDHEIVDLDLDPNKIMISHGDLSLPPRSTRL